MKAEARGTKPLKRRATRPARASAPAAWLTSRPRLYSDLAYLWPLLSPPEASAREARHAARLLRSVLRPRRGERPRLLDLGCGGGHLLSHLTRWFDATAVDLSPDMLALSRGLNPNVAHHLGDMRTIRLKQRSRGCGVRCFDAVLIHDAIDYMLTEADLRAAFATAAAHLRPGGVLLLLPDYLRETFPSHQASHRHFETGGLDAACVSHVADPDPRDTTFELAMLFLIHEPGPGPGAPGRLRIEEDRHTCGLFPLTTWLRLLRETGFKAGVHERDAAARRERPGLAPAILAIRAAVRSRG